jgi:UDP-N-acetylmuramate--alanine ligase
MREDITVKYAGKRIHMVGILGSSMAGLAEMLVREGLNVSGSDTAASYAQKRLNGLGIEVRIGHHPEMVEGAGLLVYSAAISAEDPECIEAIRLHIPQMERAVMLGELMAGYRISICICGTHGKTTTSAMVAQLLTETGFDPSIHLGGNLDAIGGSVRQGNGNIFVAEACEFNRSFLQMPVTHALLLNIEEDHLDCYGDMEHVEEAYLTFLERLPEDGAVIALGSDERVVRVIGKLQKKQRRILTFGSQPEFDFTFGSLVYDSLGCAGFQAIFRGQPFAEARLKIPGLYNALHALAVLAMAHVMGADMGSAAESIKSFTGAHRRLEHTGTMKGMDLYHDYGHNPAEMQAAINMLKPRCRRMIAVMQPHTFSRVKTLFKDYLTCTGEADITLVTDIFAAREKDPGDINSLMLVDGMRQQGLSAFYTPGFDNAERWLLKHGQPDDLILTLGCGNINLLNEQMQRNFEQSTILD